ncbi:MAG: hypothetical protein OCC45_09485 [Desulfotalea sp.]
MILIAIDDTDMPGTKGTGWIFQQITEELADLGWGLFSSISRHQLFVHEDIPFTSHNSSMCCELVISKDKTIENLILEISEKLIEKSISGSDPGLCVVQVEEITNEQKTSLIEFGKKAKVEVLNKNTAYQLAEDLKIHLSEHGGTGDGIIGAIAGIGLRLYGNDGRYRGWYHLGPAGTTLNSEQIKLKIPFIDGIYTDTGIEIANETVEIGSEKIKCVRIAGKQVLLVKGNTGSASYRTITHIEAKKY